MTAKRYSHDGITIIDHLKKDLIYIDGKENLLELAEYVDKLQEENEQLKQSYKEFEDECQSTFNAMNREQNDLYRKNFKLKEENEQLKSELEAIREERSKEFKIADGRLVKK